MTTNREELARTLLERHFIGEAFKDELFAIDNNVREMACAWKLQGSPMLLAPLATGRVRLWNTVGIPLGLVDKSFEGDFDLMFALDPFPEKAETIYRSFELKTSKVDRSGKVTSLKTAKFHKTISQLEKLSRMGASQVFLLEVFIVEVGFSGPHDKMPDSVGESVAQKREKIAGADFGYVVTAIEQIPDYDVRKVGIHWPTAEVQAAKLKHAGSAFADVVQRINAYQTEKKPYGKVISYCPKCHDLTAVNPKGPYACETCAAALLA